MQFTRLRLQGFKSFVDPTDLVISTGLTGVVGPNGCGKSNLLEALRWVMGENRAKQMRGDGMEDVIFAGAESRPARNNASVDLVLDNSDRLAPASFNDSDQLEVSRRITRDIGSAYTLNGKNVRMRDVQMLFADASTGAHSPALVRQGQISELINAKPKARRRILEEAAGISGLYQRRHEAELKLNGAETNLARVEDVLENLDGQLRSLERQANQARRYREIADELRQSEAVLLFLRWHLADQERVAAETRLNEAMSQAAGAEGAVLRANQGRDAADEALPPLREEEMIAAAAHQRLAIEGEQLGEAERRAVKELEGLEGRIRTMGLDMDREETLSGDASETIARLDAEATELGVEHQGHPEAVAQALEKARAAGDELSEQETKLDRLTETAARLAARTSAAERRRDEARAATDRISRDIEASEAQGETLTNEIRSAQRTLDQARDQEVTKRTAAEEAEEALSEAEVARSSAQSADAEARSTLSEAKGGVGALVAEVQALEKLLERDASETTQLIDQLQVEAGYEAALGVALGDDLRLGVADQGSGWTDLSPVSGNEIGGSLAVYVKAPSVLDRRLARIGIVDDRKAGDHAQKDLLPGQRLVSREGDLWRWDGVRIRSEDATSTAAHRLQQRNQLVAQKAALADADQRLTEAKNDYDAVSSRLRAVVEVEKTCREVRRSADQEMADAVRAISRAEADLDMCKGRLETQKAALEARQTEREAAEAAVSEALAAISELDDVVEARQAVEIQRGEVDLARTAMLSARSGADELRRQGIAREKRISDVQRERAGWIDRRDNAASRIADFARRIEEAEAQRDAASDRPDELAEKRATLKSRLDEAEARRRAAADALSVAETTLREAEGVAREAERDASVRREARARAEALRDAAASKVDEASSQIEADLETTPEALLEATGLDPAEMPEAGRAEAEVAKLRRQRDSLGAVNLRAEEDAREIREEREALASEKEDLDTAIGKLRSGIGELNREGRQRIVEAFEQVNEKFSGLFRHLFGGGEARLVMVESDD
ncbi:MAG: AAA family ATPase, partial [Pseudomonadota bacterium]